MVCQYGKILAESPLPIFGIMSDLPIEIIADRLQEIKSAVADLGVPFPRSSADTDHTNRRGDSLLENL